jgi:hypothetical protein
LRPSYSGFDLLTICISVLLAAAGALGIARGRASGWLVMLFFLACAGTLAAAPWINARRNKRMQASLTVDEWGVRRRLGVGKEAKEEAVAWERITELSIITTSDGPFAEDVFFALRGSDGTGVLVAQSLAMEHDLLKQLQTRLPDLDNEAIVRAMGSTTQARFILWPPRPASK